MTSSVKMSAFLGVISLVEMCTCQMDLSSMMPLMMLSRGGGGGGSMASLMGGAGGMAGMLGGSSGGGMASMLGGGGGMASMLGGGGGMASMLGGGGGMASMLGGGGGMASMLGGGGGMASMLGGGGGMASMLGGGGGMASMLGGGGGMASMLGGGGGMASMLGGSSAGGMAGLLGGMSGGAGMFGGNRNLAMAGMTGLTGDLTAADIAVLTNAVKTVVGRHASPDFMMFRFAAMKEGRPKTLVEMLPYTTFMVNIAKRVGLQMPDGSIQFPIGTQSSQRNQFVLSQYATNKQGGSATTGGSLTMRQLREIVQRRTMSWFARNSLMRRAGLMP